MSNWLRRICLVSVALLATALLTASLALFLVNVARPRTEWWPTFLRPGPQESAVPVVPFGGYFVHGPDGEVANSTISIEDAESKLKANRGAE